MVAQGQLYGKASQPTYNHGEPTSSSASRRLRCLEQCLDVAEELNHLPSELPGVVYPAGHDMGKEPELRVVR